MFRELRASLIIIVLFTGITGIGYPFLMTNLGQLIFAYQANGSLVEGQGHVIGSALIGQNFVDDKYFHSRPSAAGDGYDAANSSGSNLAPSSFDLHKTVVQRVEQYRHDGGNPAAIPADLVTASGSGLDPDISVASANYQAMRISKVRNIPLPRLMEIISDTITPPAFGILGESRVNVLALNRVLDTQTTDAP